MGASRKILFAVFFPTDWNFMLRKLPNFRAKNKALVEAIGSMPSRFVSSRSPSVCLEATRGHFSIGGLRGMTEFPIGGLTVESRRTILSRRMSCYLITRQGRQMPVVIEPSITISRFVEHAETEIIHSKRANRATTVKRALVLLFVCLLFGSGNDELLAQKKTLRFRGAWFDVWYPSAFTQRISKREEGGKGKAESVFFVSPDRSAEFYVYSSWPLGRPDDILIDTLKETLVSSLGTLNEEWLTRRITARAIDGSYERLYELRAASQAEEEAIDGRYDAAFGFKYKNEATRIRYVKQYERFRKSLKQYAD
jgi:hypothetical protein